LVKSIFNDVVYGDITMQEREVFLSEEIRERLDRITNIQIVQSMGMRTESISSEGEVRVSMDVSDKINALGGAHGGAIFTLADQAFALACNLGKEPQVALCANINYIKPAKGKLEAVARMISETRKTSIYEVKVFEAGELVALFQGTGYKLNGTGRIRKLEEGASR